jgi:hypothetical protein
MNYICLSRESDIQKRGKDILVYDLNREIVNLVDAQIWYNYDGDYVEPREYTQKKTCFHFFCLIPFK